MHIVGISGSLRRRPFNTALLRHASASMPVGEDLAIAEIGDLPLHNHDSEVEGFPQSVERLRREVAEAGGLLIAAPEYVEGAGPEGLSIPPPGGWGILS